MPHPARILALALLLAACKDDAPGLSSEGSGTSGTTGTTGTSDASPTPTTGTSGTPTTGTATATGDGTTGTAATCNCMEPIEANGCTDASIWSHVPDCALPIPCDPLTVQCPRPGADLYDCQNELVFDEAAMVCALEAMRDRTPGRFILEGTEGGLTYIGTTFGVRLRGDEIAVVSECREGDLGTGLAASEFNLAPPAHFSECLAGPGGAARYACLFAGLDNPVPLKVCLGD